MLIFTRLYIEWSTWQYRLVQILATRLFVSVCVQVRRNWLRIIFEPNFKARHICFRRFNGQLLTRVLILLRPNLLYLLIARRANRCYYVKLIAFRPINREWTYPLKFQILFVMCNICDFQYWAMLENVTYNERGDKCTFKFEHKVLNMTYLDYG